MARYRGAKLRITRRLGDLPGLTSKKGKRTQRPGQHGANQKKLTQYAIVWKRSKNYVSITG